MVQSGIQSTILVRDKETPSEIHVNFDPEIFTLIRETDLIIKMDLEVPEKAQALLRKQFYYLDLFSQIEHMLARNNEIRRVIRIILRFRIQRFKDSESERIR